MNDRRNPNQEGKRGWTHPVHAKGVQAQRMAGAHIGEQLTDSRIKHYIRLGFYGTERQLALLEEERAKKQKRESRGPRNPLEEIDISKFI
jgi:hypothetical protein